MSKQFREQSGRLYLTGRKHPVHFSWVREFWMEEVYFVARGAAVVESIPETEMSIIFFNAAKAA